jgi:hypothetical protein
MIRCKVCGATLPPHLRDCVNGHPNAYPNVRVASHTDEADALLARVTLVQIAANTAGTSSELGGLRQAALTTHAVMARNLKALNAFVGSDNAMLATYYKQVRSGARLPEDNYWDRHRTSLDSAVNPHIHDEIQFAALSLTGRGPSWYGRYHVSLKEIAICDRSTVFDRNPFAFFKLHKIVYGDPVPNGYRAPWSSRHLLLEAKVGANVKSGMKLDDFAALVLDDNGGGPDADFVEVHIYGNIHLDAVERVVAKPVRGERQIWARIRKRLVSLGVMVEEF